MHTVDLIASIHKYTIIPWHPLEPQRCCLDDLLLHAFSVAQITGCMKGCNCTVDNVDMA
jgi:hypothetical protein